MSFAVCVFCSSSGAAGRQYLAVARELGASIARRRFTLVYGGAASG
jgi:predicted Rossmann-fold nucleotide-binding protein